MGCGAHVGDGNGLVRSVCQSFQLMEMFLDTLCISLVCRSFLGIGEELGVEQLFHLAIQVATSLLYFKTELADAYRFGGSYAPNMNAITACRTCQRDQ